MIMQSTTRCISQAARSLGKTIGTSSIHDICPRILNNGILSVKPSSASLANHSSLPCCRFASSASSSAQSAQRPRVPGSPAGHGASMQVHIRSPNVLAEPYRGSSSILATLFRQLTDSFRRRNDAGSDENMPTQHVSSPYGVVSHVMGGLKSYYTLLRLRKDVPGFSLGQFRMFAEQSYQEVSLALAKGTNLNRIQQQVSDAFLKTAKNEVIARERGGWKRVELLFESIDKVSILQARMLKMYGYEFAQITCEIHSKQRFCAYNAEQKIVQGDPNCLLQVSDIWVFEVKVDGPTTTSRWIVCGRLPQFSTCKLVTQDKIT